MLLRSVVALPLLFLLVVLEYALGLVIPPLTSHVLAREAVQNTFAGPLDGVLFIGLRLVPVLLGLVVVAWWIFGSIRDDVRQVPRQEGFR